MLIVEGENLCSLYNALVISRLCNSAENRVFQPNPSVVVASYVDFSIVCCHNSHSHYQAWALNGPSATLPPLRRKDAKITIRKRLILHILARPNAYFTWFAPTNKRELPHEGNPRLSKTIVIWL